MCVCLGPEPEPGYRGRCPLKQFTTTVRDDAICKKEHRVALPSRNSHHSSPLYIKALQKIVSGRCSWANATRIPISYTSFCGTRHGKQREKGEKDPENVIWCIFNSSLQTAIHPSSEHLQCTWHAHIEQEQPYLRGSTVSCSEPSWSHSSVWAKRGPALPAPVHALLLPHQFQADLKLHWFQLAKVIDNKSSIWEAARRGVDTANFSIMKLLYISTSIS